MKIKTLKTIRNDSGHLKIVYWKVSYQNNEFKILRYVPSPSFSMVSKSWYELINSQKIHIAQKELTSGR